MRIVVLTQVRRPDRMAAFWQRWPGRPVPLRVHVTRAGHRPAMRAVWQQMTEDTLVLEDDVILQPDWSARLSGVRAALPADWDLLYLGGQHHYRPVPVAQGLVRCTGTHRTHAVLVRHRAVPRLLALTETVDRHHLDAELSRCHEQGLLRAYAVQPWLAGQAAGHSDITGRDEPERWWHDEEDP